ncbi:hypothetical protein K505DRAFT_413117 [Melanomma pulvis-pyrius CBS 109.77]|uniref:PH domain-containing protein n=1 Tax=Melanomma pulvis-pyrius CBS 109.77 TaxID=1314802 RepID=A0A6A6XWQ9_9PLEO|nr:hypothetical protein K505DRAFT_413117 [Melanomma pulvis-pyrius CBS 109.77]
MTTAIAKYAAKKMLNGEMNKYKDKKVESPYDPFYEMIPHPRKAGKFKKVKKQIPSYIPAHDADILAKARKRAYKLDFCLFNFLGFRFGWSSVIGLVPAVGDGVDMLLALRLIYLMRGVTGGLPNATLVWMVVNMIVDFLVGLIPFVGDLADAAIKCNSKNVRLFEEHLDKTYKPKRLQDEDNALPAERRPRPATVYEDFSDEELPPAYDERHDNVQRPSRAHSGRRDRVPDVEMGLPREDTHRSRKDERPSRDNTKSGRR